MLNPITYTEKVVSDFLRYQLTTYPFADARLHAQMRRLLSLEETRNTPLMRGPYISLSRSFRQGSALADLAAAGILHPHIARMTPFTHAYGHQDDAFRAIAGGKTTLVSTGTGSGKTECFLYPIISRCLELRDQGAPPGITAVIVYPMNALAEDQLGRLRELLVGTGITVGMYTGRTPETPAKVAGVRLAPGASRAEYLARVAKLRQDKQAVAVHPAEERVSRSEMRTPGGAPRILLTNVKQLELLLTRRRDVELFDGARLEFLVFDEAHTFSGVGGAETACLIRRLRAFCGKKAHETVCVATSATIADPKRGPEAGRDFAARFFGVPAGQVALVGEQYEDDPWADDRATEPALREPGGHLQAILEVLGRGDSDDTEATDLGRLSTAFQAMTGAVLDSSSWQESLYERLARSNTVVAIAQALTRPRSLSALVAELCASLRRPITEEEILCWLALGAASRKQGRPLLRPVVHAFVRGISGAVVTFARPDAGPELWLSAEDAATNAGGDDSPREPNFRLPVMTCTTCGQHYFEHHASDFHFADAVPGGGEAIEDRVIWRPLDQAEGGNRIVLLDGLIADDEDAEPEPGGRAAPRNTAPVYLCHRCGTLHPAERTACDGCGTNQSLVRVFAVRTQRRPGHLSSCLACGAIGRDYIGRYREPCRPVRAVTVSDVHVLGQSMIQHAERRRLLIFADNRQDAAFQAGWMQDHARRYRFRALMFERLLEGPASVGDLSAWLDDRLDRDDDLSRALVPEVWQVARKEAAGILHAAERRRFLRIQVLREVATGNRQRIGLEPWGRLRVRYLGLEPTLPPIRRWAGVLGCSAAELADGVASLLDSARRSRMLLDREGRMFSKYWHESEREVQRGYMPLIQGGPRGLKLRREPDDHQGRVQQWLSARGGTTARQAARRWGVDRADIDGFFDELWRLLTEELGLLAPVTLTSTRGQPLSNCADVKQVDADKLLLEAHRGVYRCTTCRRPHARRTPSLVCMAWRCSGTLVFEEEPDDNYDLMVLDQSFAMMRPREHSAQIPSDERERIERAFKGHGERVNTLVCTPTLELGVDIGGLDGVLMRNVPPRPANYWQRAGRAGRRHRMAVNLTYARPASHDRAYFAEPLHMLEGMVVPPSFNLTNQVMLKKHVHAAVLTTLFQLAREGSSLTQGDRMELQGALEQVFPDQVKSYLFDCAGHLRTAPFDVSPFATVAGKHRSALLGHACEVFSQGWPEDARHLVTDEELGRCIDNAADELDLVIRRLAARLRWATEQMARLEGVRRVKGTLDPEEDALFLRCDRLVKKLKGIQSRKRREAEGYDDTDTYGVLAAEAFLPGYGLDAGWVVGFHLAPRFGGELRDWELRRSLPLALREYVPGNLIYANGHRFVPRFFQLEAVDPTLFQIDTGSEAVVEVGTARHDVALGMGTRSLAAMPICDVNLPHFSQISDDEEYRFQLPVAVYGYAQGRHGQGKAYAWGQRTLTRRSAVHLRLVNVGTASAARSGGELGYPVCTVCGQSRSPFASQAELEGFSVEHHGRCGKTVGRLGFYADVVADALTLQDCSHRTQAFSVMEAIRQGAANVMEMEVDDLQVLAIGRAGSEAIDVLLYDPMPGGSGLLEQLIERWPEVVAAARRVVEGCASQCQSACIDCLLLFRNAFYHRYLNRNAAIAALDAWGEQIRAGHDIRAHLPDAQPGGQAVSQSAQILEHMLRRAGLSGFEQERPIELGKPLGRTVVDFYFEDPSGRFEGVCIYLDGMSGHLHGNPETKQRDRQLREEMRACFYEVIEITYSQLFDRGAMERHFYRLGRILLGREGAQALKDAPDWFDAPVVEERIPERAESADAQDAGWDECLELLDARWHVLAHRLRDAGLPAPFEIDFELTRQGRVAETRAVMVWRLESRLVGLVEEQAGGACGHGFLAIDAQTDASAIISFLRDQGGV